MRASWLLLLRLGVIGASNAVSPPIEASVQASWDAPTLAVQYLETLALEEPTALLPFLGFLTSPTSASADLTALSDRSLKLISQLPAPLGAHVALSAQLQPNETYALLEHALTQSKLVRSQGHRESLRLALGAREASVAIEGMRLVEEHREREVILRPDDNVQAEETCLSWLDVGGAFVSSEEEFWRLVGEEQRQQSTPILVPGSGVTTPRTYAFDHLHPLQSDESLPLVVFYAYPDVRPCTTTSARTFENLYNFLLSLSTTSPVVPANPKSKVGTKTAAQQASSPRLRFALRWGATRLSEQPQKLVLSGYGAGLDIKKSDYLAIDDRLASSEDKSIARDAAEGAEIPKMVPVRKSDIAELGLRATSHIMASTSPLEAFVNLTSNFPLLASQLSTLVPFVSADLEEEVGTFQMTSPLSQRPSFHLNGIALPESAVDPFALLRSMRRERKIVNDILSVSSDMSPKQARKVLMHEAIGAAASGAPATRGRDVKFGPEMLGDLFDAGDEREGGDLILWWNDLEKDKRYKTWSKDLKDMLRPVYPGQMNLIRRNLNSVVFVLDFSQPTALALLAENVRNFVSRGIPLRFGVVPQVTATQAEDDVSAKVAQVLWYTIDKLGRAPAMTMLLGDLALVRDVITEPILSRIYAEVVRRTSESVTEPLASYEEVIKGLEIEADSPDSRLSKARAYVKRLAVARETDTKALGSFFIDGAHFILDDEWTQNLQRILGSHVQYLQQVIYQDKLKNSQDVNRYFFNLPSTHARRNPYIFPSQETNPLKIVNLVDAAKSIGDTFVQHLFIEAVAPEQLTEPEAGPPPAVASLYIITDLNSFEGRDFARAALELATSTPHTRVALLHNSAETHLPQTYDLSNLIYLLSSAGAFPDLLPSELIAWIDLDIDHGGPHTDAGESWNEGNPLSQFLQKGANRRTALRAKQWWLEGERLVQSFGFNKGEHGIVLNGRVVGPFDDDAFGAEDLKNLVQFERQKRIDPVISAVASSGFDLMLLESSQLAHLYNSVTSVISEAYLPDPAAGAFGGATNERHTPYHTVDNPLSSIIGPHEEDGLIEIAVVIDPATELAQRWAPIILTLSALESVHLRVYLNPSMMLREVPVKRFYQYSFSPVPTFDNFSGAEVQPAVRFAGIPEDVLLTFSTDLQQSWLAFPKTSVHDLDNIRLADLPSWSRNEGVRAVLELESIIVEGHARELPSSAAPRGLQVELLSGTALSDAEEKRGDTIVMANLGYFQLKAGPGPFRLAIREGKSAETYSFESIGAEGWKSGDVSQTGDSLLVSTLEGLTLYPRLRRNPGFETVQLLDETEVPPIRAAGLFDRLKNMIPFLAAPGAVPIKKSAEINVFTVASGLLYERMAFLMMVSVMRHTKSTVKFWFIQNFLSPSFRAFIPHMAQEYGFEYELVTYKWPHWLRAQKEKQRTIWGYKILFLDVLFPLELERVIFVDSDQIVRTDLKELIDMDLKGAPYAYAPMGDDRPEMEGFRFWKTGYWKEHLKQLPYHISALYLVDLDRFRKVAAGDRLRQQYQGLSADPNSLANLDQDLPNNMQTAIPIHTLDKSWLWCETWCSDESLAQARTIDLCNNPLTHEPKLQRAKRLIPEWTVYDDEVAALARRVAATESAIGAFGKKADDLEQAVQQQEERAEFVESKGGDAAGTPQRLKDEL